MNALIRQYGNSPKIAILRAGGLGDFLSTTPAIRALKSHIPGARITLITGPEIAALAQRYNSLSRAVVSPFYQGVRRGPDNQDEVNKFFWEMRSADFDLAFQWHGGGRNSNPYVKRLGARLTVGTRTADAEELDISLPHDFYQHEIMRYLDQLLLLGIPSHGTDMDLPVLPSDFDDLRVLADTLDLAALYEGRYIGVHLGAGTKSRRWSPKRYAAVVDELVDEFGLDKIGLTGGAGETEYAQEFINATRHPKDAIDLCGKTSLGGLIAFISRLGLFLGNDTGAAHMAVALDVPSVTVFGSGNPLNWGALNRTWHRVAANWSSPCRHMLNDGCQETENVPCLISVQVEDVLTSARRLLQLKRDMARLESPSVDRDVLEGAGYYGEQT